MITERIFGMKQGIEVPEITLYNKSGMELSLLAYGATLRSLYVPSRSGKLVDVALGYDTLEEYLNNSGYFGGTIGRFANRIGGAAFDLDGVHYPLAANSGPNTLHGGIHGFDHKIWKYYAQGEYNRITFYSKSADGEEGFPGELSFSTSFTLTEDNAMIIEYRAETTKATPVNMTNHWYFNLNGEGDILGHQLRLNADAYTVENETLVPTGQIALVEGTPLDFRQMKTVGQDFEAVRVTPPGGYDHNYTLGDPGVMKEFAEVYAPESGIRMTAATNVEGVQFYTGNFISERPGKAHRTYHAQSGMCLETQHYPDAVNHPEFPSSILRPGKTYLHRTEFRFSWN